MTRAVLVALAVAWAGSARAALVSQVHYVMGTYLQVTTNDDAPADALAACFARVRDLDRVFSRFDPSSEIVRLNAAGGGPVGPDVLALLPRALALREATAGTFDVTVAVGRPAVAGAVRVDAGRVVLASGTRLDFDGLAKGYAADECAARLQTAGVRRLLVDFGESSLVAVGAPPGEAAWALALRGPDPDVVVATLRLRDAAASISAVFGSEGRHAGRAGHIVDPRSGAALRDDTVGVIVAPRATEAEAYSKALLVWGRSGLARVERLPGVRAARVTRGGVERGQAMARSGALVVLAAPRPLDDEEAALR